MKTGQKLHHKRKLLSFIICFKRNLSTLSNLARRSTKILQINESPGMFSWYVLLVIGYLKHVKRPIDKTYWTSIKNLYCLFVFENTFYGGPSLGQIVRNRRTVDKAGNTDSISINLNIIDQTRNSARYTVYITLFICKAMLQTHNPFSHLTQTKQITIYNLKKSDVKVARGMKQCETDQYGAKRT